MDKFPPRLWHPVSPIITPPNLNLPRPPFRQRPSFVCSCGQAWCFREVPMASAEALEDDRDTSLPASALSPAEYRSFRAFLLELHHAAGSPDRHAPLFAVLEFLVSFNGVNLSVAQQVRNGRHGLDLIRVDCRLCSGEGRGVRRYCRWAGLCHDSIDRTLAERGTDREINDICAVYFLLALHTLTCGSTRSRPDILPQRYDRATPSIHHSPAQHRTKPADTEPLPCEFNHAIILFLLEYSTNAGY